MTREHYFKTKLLAALPSAVAGFAAFGAMTLVGREWAAQVGLLVYFPVLIVLADGIDLEVGGGPEAYGWTRAKVMTVAAILNMANVRAIQIASRIKTSLFDRR